METENEKSPNFDTPFVSNNQTPPVEPLLNYSNPDMAEKWNRKNNNRRIFGFVLLIIGVLTLLSHITDLIPNDIFTIPVVLIAVGVFVSFRSRLRSLAGPIFILIGGVYLASDLGVSMNVNEILWPSIMIIVALWLIFVKKKPRYSENQWNQFQGYQKKNTPPFNATSGVGVDGVEDDLDTDSVKSSVLDAQEDKIECTAVLGGTIKKIQSKNFLGGEVLCFLGGCELDFTKADIKTTATLDITCVMGGVKLFLPPNWVVSTSQVNILGGVEDKRMINPNALPSNKKLFITGTTCLGGLEIRN